MVFKVHITENTSRIYGFFAYLDNKRVPYTVETVYKVTGYKVNPDLR